ncbi:LAME_0G01684g1_1 [Lachancea meyersii CBS 8951]|uniref:LAME_0G01684g1_1 n=1 Tax=Lachancea meyersii CBS 8951 TaxID=1266667 RepID=A0A1G4K5H7_9SACH|nr:LAME_0G01684g1_1 [Lachancea meyersii CBS 8951]
MSAQYPPSSPIASFRDDDNDPFYQPVEKESASTLNFFKRKTGVSHATKYPTPNPSSTLGKSSPLKTSAKLLSSSQTPSECEFEHELHRELNFAPVSTSAEPLEIPLDPRFETRVSVGRKNTLCDVVLPRHKNVSRLHAFVTYSPQTKEVQVECKGTNGLVVVFPVKLDLKLTISAEHAKTYRLVDEANCDLLLATKELVRDTELTSFVVLQGETVYMPYIKHTILDFRQVECELNLKEALDDNYDDLQNETETEDELVPLNITSDDFPQEPHTPPRIMTPPSFQGPSSSPKLHMKPLSQAVKNLPSTIPQPKPEATIEQNVPSNVPQSSPIAEARQVIGSTTSHTEPAARTKQDLSSVRSHSTIQNVKTEIEQQRPMETKGKDQKKTPKSLKDAKDEHSAKHTKVETITVPGRVGSDPSIKPSEIPKTPEKRKENSHTGKTGVPLRHTDENSRRRKYASPSPIKNHKRKNQPEKAHISSADILLQVASRGIAVADLQHVLANHLAFSNVQQVPFSQLRDVNSTISKLKAFELRALLEAAKCIGVIYRKGKDAAGRPLDEEYYYDLENDTDANRRQLVSSLKGGRSGLRSCRRVHKQYFWKKPTK